MVYDYMAYVDLNVCKKPLNLVKHALTHSLTHSLDTEMVLASPSQQSVM